MVNIFKKIWYNRKNLAKTKQSTIIKHEKKQKIAYNKYFNNNFYVKMKPKNVWYGITL